MNMNKLIWWDGVYAFSFGALENNAVAIAKNKI